jgi:hypothetical protein
MLKLREVVKGVALPVLVVEGEAVHEVEGPSRDRGVYKKERKEKRT